MKKYVSIVLCVMIQLIALAYSFQQVFDRGNPFNGMWAVLIAIYFLLVRPK